MMLRALAYALALMMVHLLAPDTYAQPVPVGDFYEDYARLLQITDASNDQVSFAVRPNSFDCRNFTESHPWSGRIDCGEPPQFGHLNIGAASPVSHLYVNSRRPFGQNDAVVWQGVGATATLSSGFFAEYRFVSAFLRPQLLYTQNAHFELSRLPLAKNQSIYAYPYRDNIDWPQRFGDDPWTDLVLDGSFIEIAYRSLAAGLSTQNLWWGPGIRNSIIMSNNAGAIKHFYIGSDDRIETPIGGFEGRWIWGNLSHSEYFVDGSYAPDRENRGSEENDRFATSITLNWNPVWVPGLYVGAAHSLVLHYSVEKRFFRDYLGLINLPFFDGGEPRGRGKDDKMISLYGRWFHADSGVEVYGEWARGDHTSNFRDIFVEPDHGRGWTVGIQKVFKPRSKVWTRFLLEMTTLENPRESGFRSGRGSYFYAHESIKQGYTQKGQIIGAGIGPGSNSQYVQFDVFAPFGRVGVHLLRWVRDNDRYFIYFLSDENRNWHEVELGGGASFVAFWKGFEFGGSFTYTTLLNQDYVFSNDVPNLNLQVTLRKQLMGLR